MLRNLLISQASSAIRLRLTTSFVLFDHSPVPLEWSSPPKTREENLARGRAADACFPALGRTARHVETCVLRTGAGWPDWEDAPRLSWHRSDTASPSGTGTSGSTTQSPPAPAPTGPRAGRGFPAHLDPRRHSAGTGARGLSGRRRRNTWAGAGGELPAEPWVEGLQNRRRRGRASSFSMIRVAPVSATCSKIHPDFSPKVIICPWVKPQGL